ncbi:MAG TPA: ferritin, partial [bacterium]|nr:ferritin [bacterium]
KIEKALNEQMIFEAYSGYIYLAMAAWAETQNMGGFASWLRVQFLEETMIHAKKFHDFIIDRGGVAVFDAVPKPPAEYASMLEVFAAAYKHETVVTDRIYKLVELAEKEGDRATFQFLQWFIEEQVEEEKQTDDIVQQLKMIDKSVNGLFMLNHALKGRTFNPAG